MHCSNFTNRCQGNAPGLPRRAPLTAQVVQRYQLRALADAGTSRSLSGLKQPPATSDSPNSPSNNIVPLGHNPRVERDATDKLSQDKTVPENVASARAWIAAWKAKQLHAPAAAVPEHVASARAWIAAWRARNQGAPGAAGVTEVDALRHEVEKLKGLVSAAEAAAAEARAELNRTSANRDLLAFSLARQVFEAATLRKQCDAALAALNNEKEHVRVLISQQQRSEVKAASARQQDSAAAPNQLPAVPQPAAPYGGFTNTNRFWVPNHLEPQFLRVVAERQAAMQQAPGFLGLSVREFTDPSHPVEEFVLEVSSRWATVPDWEAWSGGRESLRHPLPNGVMQYPPKKGEGFPEDYVPFKDLAGEVPNAKY